MFANNLQNYCKKCTSLSRQSTLQCHLECATQNTLQIVFASVKNRKSRRLYYSKFFGNYVGTIQNKRFAMRKNTLRKFHYCLNLQLSTQQICHRAHHSFARRKLCNFCTKGYTTLNKKNGTFNKCKRAQMRICASDQNGCFHLYVWFWLLRKNGLVAFCTIARQKIASKNPHTGCGF